MPDIRKALNIVYGAVISNEIENPTTIGRLIVHFVFLSMDLYVMQLLRVGSNCGWLRILQANSGLDFENAQTAIIKETCRWH